MKKLFAFVIAVVFILPFFMNGVSAGNVAVVNARPWEDPDPPASSFNIRNLGTGSVIDYVLVGSSVEIIVQSSISPVYYSIDGGSNVLMTQFGTTERYYASWIPSSTGTYTITAISGSESDSATVQAVGDYVAHLYFEIDYMVGHEPSQNVLDYWVAYWDSRAIELVYKIDDVIPYTDQVSDVYAYEAQYNDWEFQAYGTQDDRCYGDSSQSVFLSQEKWMLYGSYYSSQSTGGLTYVSLDGTDDLGGNYIFIADEMIENFEASYGIPNHGAEACVTMHEAGHAIGILIASSKGRSVSEVYDAADYYNIMSSMHTENCGFDTHWYYAANYWNTRNIGYYA